MYLVDTNIFLEILLDQDNCEKCREFLENNPGTLFISDFSLHSIGVILFRNGKEDAFQAFLDEILGNIETLSLAEHSYAALKQVKADSGFDFDDAYQYLIARDFGLQIVTMDKDFRTLQDVRTRVVFIGDQEDQ